MMKGGWGLGLRPHTPILTLVAQYEVTKNTYSMADKSALAFEQVVRVHC